MDIVVLEISHYIVVIIPKNVTKKREEAFSL